MLATRTEENTVQSFEQIRSHVSNLHTLRTNDPYLISFDLTLADDRHQGIYLAEMEGEDELKFLRVSTPVGPATGVDATRCMRFNWEQRTGFRDQRSRRIALPASHREPALPVVAGR